MQNEFLKFQDGKNNGKLKKLGKKVYTFSIPSGWTCPGASECLTKVHKKDGKRFIVDGPEQKFRCYAASLEVLYEPVYNNTRHNYNLLKNKTQSEMVELICSSLPNKAELIRLHVSGDFFNEDYFKAWCVVAEKNPNILFYTYTKSINYWVNNKNLIPNNLILNASFGGRFDNLIIENNLKSAEVVFSEKEAFEKGLRIDTTDELAFGNENKFALHIHGVQPKKIILN